MQAKGMRNGADVLHWTGFDKTTIGSSTKAQVPAPPSHTPQGGAAPVKYHPVLAASVFLLLSGLQRVGVHALD
jgi:hypothetical protein